MSMHEITPVTTVRIFARHDSQYVFLVFPSALIGICGACMGRRGNVIPLAQPTLHSAWIPEIEACTCQQEGPK